MFVPAFGTHICLGAPYGWSAISSTLSKEIGFVASSSADWTLDLCTYPMSIMIAAGGISSALLGMGLFTNNVDKNFTDFDHVSIPCGHALAFFIPCMYCPRGHFKIQTPLIVPYFNEYEYVCPILAQFFQPINCICMYVIGWQIS